MEKNPYDTITDRVFNDINIVADRVATKYKNVQPYDTTKIPNDRLLAMYEDMGTLNQMGQPIMQFFVQRYGPDVMSRFIYDMEQLRKRRDK